MHPAAEFAVLAGPKREVEMIGHEAVGQDSHRLAQAGFGHQLDESVVVVGFMTPRRVRCEAGSHRDRDGKRSE